MAPVADDHVGRRQPVEGALDRLAIEGQIRIEETTRSVRARGMSRPNGPALPRFCGNLCTRTCVWSTA